MRRGVRLTCSWTAIAFRVHLRTAEKGECRACAHSFAYQRAVSVPTMRTPPCIGCWRMSEEAPQEQSHRTPHSLFLSVFWECVVGLVCWGLCVVLARVFDQEAAKNLTTTRNLYLHMNIAIHSRVRIALIKLLRMLRVRVVLPSLVAYRSCTLLSPSTPLLQCLQMGPQTEHCLYVRRTRRDVCQHALQLRLSNPPYERGCSFGSGYVPRSTRIT